MSLVTLLWLNFFFTFDMSKNYRTPNIHQILPVFLIKIYTDRERQLLLHTLSFHFGGVAYPRMSKILVLSFKGPGMYPTLVTTTV